MRYLSNIYVIPIIVSILLAVGIISVMTMLYDYENERIEQEKEKTRILVEKTAERRETRLEIISNAFIGFFENSQVVTQDEFIKFSKTILDKDKILAVFILDSNKISYSFPDHSLIGNDYDLVFTQIPAIINDTPFIGTEFSFDNNTKKIILAITADYFLPAYMPNKHYKIKILESDNTDKILNEYEKNDSGEKTKNVVFSNTEKENAVTISDQTEIVRHKTQKSFVLISIIWASEYEINHTNIQRIFVVIIILSIGIVLLSIRSVKLKKQADKNKDELAKLNLNLNNIVEQRTDELRRANKELEKQHILQTEFINIASHELRSPIQPMLSYLDLIEKKLITTDIALPILSLECKRLQKLANDILDVSRIESGTLKINPTKIRINEVIRNSISTLKVNFKKDVSLITNLGETNNLIINTDDARLTQVINNILNNSIKFTDKGHIKIETHIQNKNHVEIIISDTGGGIPQEILPRLFEKFASKSVKETTYHGTGLGLFISKAIVEEHGGKISGYNNNEGGATFIISIPIK